MVCILDIIIKENLFVKFSLDHFDNPFQVNVYLQYPLKVLVIHLK